MLMSNLIEIGGTGSIILKPLADIQINDKLYPANKLFYANSGCDIQFQYSNTSSVAKQGQNYLVSSQKLSLRNLSINNLPLTTKILSFFKNEYVGGLKCPIIETKHGGPGLIILNHIPIEDTIELLDSNIEFTYNDEYNSIESEDFNEDTIYDIYYETEQNVSTFNLNDYSPDLPFFSIDIIMSGNYNKQQRDFHIFIPRAAVHMSPVLSLFNNSISTVSMNIVPLDTEVLLTMVK